MVSYCAGCGRTLAREHLVVPRPPLWHWVATPLGWLPVNLLTRRDNPTGIYPERYTVDVCSQDCVRVKYADWAREDAFILDTLGRGPTNGA